MRRIGLIHPGAMGASVGAAARSNNHTVLWASAERTASTWARARRAKLEDAGTVSELVKASEIVLSVCPPHAAEEVAKEVAHLGFSGVYTDCNAISPDRTRVSPAHRRRRRGLLRRWRYHWRPSLDTGGAYASLSVGTAGRGSGGLLCRESSPGVSDLGSYRGGIGHQDGLRCLHQRHDGAANGHPGDGGEGRRAGRPGTSVG